MYRDIPVYLIGICLGLLIVGETVFDRVLREDAYNFVVTGMRIAHGEYRTFQKQSTGWPLFLGGVFWVTQAETVFDAMRIARWTTITLAALSAIPIALICRRVLPDRNYAAGCLLVLTGFASVSLVRYIGKNAMSEPLFLFLVLVSVVFVTSDGNARRNFVLGSIFAALAYWVRPNGLFIVVALMLVIALKHIQVKTNPLSDILIVGAVFVGVCTPYWFARYLEFGSAFSYGPNSKYFVDHYEHVWAENIENPSFLSYLATHGWSDYYHKFVDRGILRIWNHLLRILPKFWFVLAGVSFFLYLWKGLHTKIGIVHTVILMTILGMTPVFDIFGTPRHLVYLVPFILIAGVWTIAYMGSKNWRFANIGLIGLIVITASMLPSIRTIGYEHLGLPVVRDTWAVWGAHNLHGKIAIVEGHDILRMSQHYEAEGWRVPKNFVDVQRNLTTWRPGIYRRLSDALKDFQKQNIRYVITDQNHIKRRPYLRQITRKKWNHVFHHLGSFPREDRGAVLDGVNIYRIDYSTM